MAEAAASLESSERTRGINGDGIVDIFDLVLVAVGCEQ